LRKWLVAVAGTLLIAVPTGCGGDNNNSNSTTTTTQAQTGTATGAAGQTVNVSETEFKLSPSNPRVKAGVVTFKVTNDGTTEHSLEVEGPGGESKLASPLQAGDSGTLKVSFTKPGKYEWYCPIDNHKQMGMKGEITVTGSAASSGSTGTGTGNTSGGGSSSSSGGGY
jgi:uncharacterized cupredoxin-like copper-binding protein